MAFERREGGCTEKNDHSAERESLPVVIQVHYFGTQLYKFGS